MVYWNFCLETTYITFIIEPNGIAVVRVKYQPEEIKKSKSNLIILIENNPYETFEVALVGEAFTKSVVFENLKLLPPVTSNQDSEKFSRDFISKGKKKSLRQSGSSTNTFG